jgi:hypothetical protein
VQRIDEEEEEVYSPSEAEEDEDEGCGEAGENGYSQDFICDEEEEDKAPPSKPVPVKKRRVRPNSSALQDESLGIYAVAAPPPGRKRVAAATNRRPAASKIRLPAVTAAVAAAAGGRKRKTAAVATSPALPFEGDEQSPTKIGKYEAPTVVTDDAAAVHDFSGTPPKLVTDKYMLGKNHSLQVCQVNFPGSRAFGYPALKLERGAAVGQDGVMRKAFAFNTHVSLIFPIRNALNDIIRRSGLVDTSPNPNVVIE